MAVYWILEQIINVIEAVFVIGGVLLVVGTLWILYDWYKSD